MTKPKFQNSTQILLTLLRITDSIDYHRFNLLCSSLCTKDRKCLFGNIVNEIVELSPIGKIVDKIWCENPKHFNDIELDEYKVMPNHIHGVLVIMDDCRDTACRVPTKEQFGKPTKRTLPTIMRSFKSAVTKQVNEPQNTLGVPVWQSRYYEHIIRNERELNRIREYIYYNPLKWNLDIDNPINWKNKKIVDIDKYYKNIFEGRENL